MSVVSDNTHKQLVVSHAQSAEVNSATIQAAFDRGQTMACQARRFLSRMNANTQRFDDACAAIENPLRSVPNSREAASGHGSAIVGRPGGARAVDHRAEI